MEASLANPKLMKAFLAKQQRLLSERDYKQLRATVHNFANAILEMSRSEGPSPSPAQHQQPSTKD
jgi:hypothetical protein